MPNYVLLYCNIHLFDFFDFLEVRNTLYILLKYLFNIIIYYVFTTI